MMIHFLEEIIGRINVCLAENKRLHTRQPPLRGVQTNDARMLLNFYSAHLINMMLKNWNVNLAFLERIHS